MSVTPAPSAVGSGSGMARMLADDRLVRRAASGDEPALAEIYDRYHQRLYRYCLVILGDAQDAQDALQNAMVKVLRALPGEERRIELKPWLYRIAHNESIELIRRRRETRQLDAELAAPGHGLAEQAVARQRLRQLIADLDELPERQRGALVMRELAGLDFSEIGGALGTSPEVARQTLYEARLSLRQMDEGREMTCEKVTRALSDGDGRVSRRRDLRAHLRTCAGCRRFRDEIAGRERDLAALSPLPAVAAAGILQGLLGGHAGAGGGVAAGLGGGAVKSLATSTLLKGAATVAVVAAVGVGAADRGGLIDVDPRGGNSREARIEPAAGAPAGAGADEASGPGATRARIEAGSALGAGRRTGAMRDAETIAGSAPRPAGGGNPDASASPVSQAPLGGAHPHGKGHQKQRPSAAAHGQQTAATHKAGGHGSRGAKGHPAHPAKSRHPIPPPASGFEKKPAPSSPKDTAPAPVPQGSPPPLPAASPPAPGPGAGPEREPQGKP